MNADRTDGIVDMQLQVELFYNDHNKDTGDESDHARAPVRATHEQIARDTGAVRETVTRMLRHFADDGIVSLGRGTVTVTDAEKLRKLAGM